MITAISESMSDRRYGALRRGMTRVVLVVLLLGLAVPGYAAPPNQEPDPFLIVAGTSIGSVTVGMPLEQVLTRLGRYDSQSIAIPGFPRYIWTELPAERFTGRFVVSAAGSVDAVSVSFDTRYGTSTGIHIGDRSTSVTSTLGRPAAVTYGFYDADVWFYPGIAFVIGNSHSKQCQNRVCGIGVGRGFAEIF